MTNERAINVIKDIKNYYNDKSEYYEDGYIGFDKEDNEAIDLAIKALEQQPCKDCISRQKALDCFEQTNTRQGAKYAIETLPSVTPKHTDEEIDKAQAVEQAYVDKMVELAVEETKRPKGKWIRIAGFEDCNYNKCSVCGVYQLFYYGKPSTNYCPNCGAEMEGEENV